MCNRFRGIKDWSEIPRVLAGKRLNFDYNPNVAPTEQVPAFLAERGKPLKPKWRASASCFRRARARSVRLF